jgi:hypothetical protein
LENDLIYSDFFGKFDRQKDDMKQKPNIPPYLLWEYDYDTFNFDKSYKLAIERVLQMGNLEQWQSIYDFYGEQKILESIEWSAQLEERDKAFSRFFLKSDFLHAS